jgi:circadian clock protein KaiC
LLKESIIPAVIWASKRCIDRECEIVMKGSVSNGMPQETQETLASAVTRCSSGCAGLDDVLGGGLPVGHVYLIEGETGTGKTTMALQFVAEGLKRREKVLYVTLSESRTELMNVARLHGLNVDGLSILEVRPSEQDLKPEGQYTVFHPAEVELNDRVLAIMAEVDRQKPTRLVIDAPSEVRMLAKDPLRCRRQILSLKEYAPENCTVLLLDDRTRRYADLELHSIVHGVVSMSRSLLENRKPWGRSGRNSRTPERTYGYTRNRIELGRHHSDRHDSRLCH